MTDRQRGAAASAAPAMLGYLYQARRALLLALERLRSEDRFLIRYEVLDDVEFVGSDDASELIQTKHHLAKEASLTDASRELWGTLEIWIELIQLGHLPAGTQLSLITTASAPAGSAASYLRPTGRDPQAALVRLAATAETSESAANSSAYIRFRALTTEEQEALLDQVIVYDNEPDIAELSGELKRAVFFAAPPDKLESFLTRLEGWWFRRLIKNLGDPEKVVLSEEINAELSHLRHQFREDDLPIDDDIMRSTVDASGYEDEKFVHQLKMIGIGNRRIFHAIRNYFRASEHRSRWTREDLIATGELENYEDRLMEEWDLFFSKMIDELGEEAAEAEMHEAAQALYHWVETNAHPPIRPAVSEPTIARGTYQILANYPRIGWHPKWQESLQNLLESARPL